MTVVQRRGIGLLSTSSWQVVSVTAAQDSVIMWYKSSSGQLLFPDVPFHIVSQIFDPVKVGKLCCMATPPSKCTRTCCRYSKAPYCSGHWLSSARVVWPTTSDAANSSRTQTAFCERWAPGAQLPWDDFEQSSATAAAGCHRTKLDREKCRQQSASSWIRT